MSAYKHVYFDLLSIWPKDHHSMRNTKSAYQDDIKLYILSIANLRELRRLTDKNNKLGQLIDTHTSRWFYWGPTQSRRLVNSLIKGMEHAKKIQRKNGRKNNQGKYIDRALRRPTKDSAHFKNTFM